VRTKLIALAMLVALRVHASPPQSPRIAALAAKPASAPALWKQLAVEGTPMIEDVHDPSGRLLVTFVYRAKPGITRVAVLRAPTLANADFAQLERVAGTDAFAWSVLVDPTARFTYFFVPNNDLQQASGPEAFERQIAQARIDPLNRHPFSGPGRAFALAELPRAPAQPDLAPRRDSAPGELFQYKVTSKSLGNARSVVVYTPPGFSTRGPAYPLVVAFDAEAAISALGLPTVLDNLIASKRIPPCVVAMIGNAARVAELPHNPAFADFVALDLVPWVRRTYHATDDPRLTVVAGISLGGIASAYVAGRHPGVFGNVLSQSGSYWWSADDAREPETHSHEFAAHARMPLRFWLEVGIYERGSPKPDTTHLAANRHFRDVLLARGYDVSYREFAGAHEYINWRGTIGDGLVALLAKPPQFADRPTPSSTKGAGIEVSAAKKDIHGEAYRRAILDGGGAAVTWLQTQDADEDTVNDAVYMLVDLGHAREAVPIIEWNATRFPKSWNALDSLGDVYFRVGDRAHSIEAFKRSLAANPKNDNAKLMLDELR
jgi:enterochelin esterase family protein